MIDKPCQNDGACEETKEGYICHCPTGFTGTNCEGQSSLASIHPSLNDKPTCSPQQRITFVVILLQCFWKETYAQNKYCYN